MKTIALDKILPNPFHGSHHKLDLARVIALSESIDNTDFWQNIIVRPHPTKKGYYEQAFGHHRKAALEMCSRKKAEFLVQDRSDVEMLRMLIDENMDDMKSQNFHRFVLDLEAVLELVARDPSIIDKPDSKTKDSVLRYAPLAICRENYRYVKDLPDVDETSSTYTALTLARFLGSRFVHKKGAKEQASPELKIALNSLEAIHAGWMNYGELEELNRLGNMHDVELRLDLQKKRAVNAWTEAVRKKQKPPTPEKVREEVRKVGQAVQETLKDSTEATIKKRREEATLAANIAAPTTTPRAAPKKKEPSVRDLYDAQARRLLSIKESVNVLMEEDKELRKLKAPEELDQLLERSYRQLVDQVLEKVAPRADVHDAPLSNVTALRKG